MGAYMMLKSEGVKIRHLGITAFLAMDEHERAQHLAPYLNGRSDRPYKDPTGDAHADHNFSLFDNTLMHKVHGLDRRHGTISVQCNKALSMDLHLGIIDKLKLSDVDAADGMPRLVLDSTGGEGTGEKKKSKKRTGGFQEAYEHINVTSMKFSKTDQDRCIFALNQTSFRQTVGPLGDKLQDECKEAVRKAYGHCSVALHDAHVLFHWNDHSFFTYHQDHAGGAAVVVNLSPCQTTFHVAGCEEDAKMDGPGAAHIIPAKIFHRSGKAPRRCIKVVFFFDITFPVDLETVAGDAAASASEVVKTESDVVKSEPKDTGVDVAGSSAS
jgi:hypothetical protein